MKNLLRLSFLILTTASLNAQIIDTNTVIEYNTFIDSDLPESTNTYYTKALNGTACTAEVIDECGVSFTTNNYGESNAGNGVGTEVCIDWHWFWGNCIETAYIYNDLDNNTTTETYNNGGDVGYSVENDIYYTFSQTALDIYTITIEPSNCSSTNGFQYAVFEGVSCNKFGDDLLAGGQSGDNWTGTQVFTIAPTDVTKDIFIQIDGYAGTECDFSVTITPTNTCTVLPVELINFKGEFINGGNYISWETLTEINNDYFSLERSNNTVDFEEVSVVQGKGNSTELQEYSFLDREILNETYYYRLKQVDFDGATTYSKIISVDGEENVKLVKIVNVMGQVVSENAQGIKFYVYNNGMINKRY